MEKEKNTPAIIKILKTILTSLLLLFPVLMLNLETSANAIYILLAISSIVYIFVYQHHLSMPPKVIVVGFATFPIAILFQYIEMQHWNGKGFDAPSRFLLAIPIAAAISSLPYKKLFYCYWSALGGVFLAFVEAIYYLHNHTNERAMTYFTWPTMFGNLIIPLGILSLGLYQDERWKKYLSLSGFFLAGVCAYLSQTRSAWCAFVVATVIGASFSSKVSIKYKLGIFLALIVSITGAISFNSSVHTRISDAIHEISRPLNEVSETSVGQRRQMWQAAWEMTKEHPWLGVGRGQFYKEKLTKIKSGQLSPSVEEFDHPHNELLFGLVEVGIFGLIGMLALYLGPLIFFIKHQRHNSVEIQVAATIGLMIVSSYITAGLFDVMLLSWVMQAPIYSMMVLLPLSIIISKKSELKTQI